MKEFFYYLPGSPYSFDFPAAERVYREIIDNYAKLCKQSIEEWEAEQAEEDE